MIRLWLSIAGAIFGLVLPMRLAGAQPDNNAATASATDVISLGVSHADVTDHYPPMGGLPLIFASTDAPSTTKLLAFSRRHQGQKVDILIDGKTMSSPIMEEPMFGQILIPASTVEEAHSLAARLEAHQARLTLRAPNTTPSVTVIQEPGEISRLTDALQRSLGKLAPNYQILSCDTVVRSNEYAGHDEIYAASCLVSAGEAKPLRVLMCDGRMVQKFTLTTQYDWGTPPLDVIASFVHANCPPGG